MERKSKIPTLMTLKSYIKETNYDMVSKVNIANFVKAFAIGAGLSLQQIDEQVIAQYLNIWADEKRFLYNFLGNELKRSQEITITIDPDEMQQKIEPIEEDDRFLPYASMTKCLKHSIGEVNFQPTVNHLNSYLLSQWANAKLNDLYRKATDKNEKITHFLAKLGYSLEYCDALGRMFDQGHTKTTNFTMSIDPVDILLCSVNPYRWRSCYNLVDGEHKDGAYAAMIDGATMLTYISDKIDDMPLTASNQQTYTLKNVPCIRERQFIVFAEDFKQIGFCSLYPSRYGRDELVKQIRTVVEDKVAEYLQLDSQWLKTANATKPHAAYDYGWDEFSGATYVVWSGLATEEHTLDKNKFHIYNHGLLCPCGCGHILPVSQVCGNLYDIMMGSECYDGDYIIDNVEYDYYNAEDDSVDWDDDWEYAVPTLEEQYKAYKQLKLVAQQGNGLVPTTEGSYADGFNCSHLTFVSFDKHVPMAFVKREQAEEQGNENN